MHPKPILLVRKPPPKPVSGQPQRSPLSKTYERRIVLEQLNGSGQMNGACGNQLIAIAWQAEQWSS